MEMTATTKENVEVQIIPHPVYVWAIGDGRIVMLNRLVREHYTNSEKRTSEQGSAADKGASYTATGI